MEISYRRIGIVFAFLSVVVAIAFVMPILIHTEHWNYEISAAQTLKSLASTQATWFQADMDKNGIKDYWAVDISGFYRILDATGNPVSFIDIAFAKADWNPIPAGGLVPVVGAPVAPMNTPSVKSGYYIGAHK